MLDLSMISYVGIHGRTNDQATADFMCRIGDKTAEMIQFQEIILLTASMPSFTPKKVRIIPISQMTYDQYAELALKQLSKWTRGDYIMNFHDDGFAVNPHNWQSSFLDYDYLGAPWKRDCGWSSPGKEVGNSGFCLRSRRLFEECQRLPMTHGMHDDGIICIQFRDYLIEKGIRFGTLEAGYKFSVEAPYDENHTLKNCFGFHASRHLDEAKQILALA